MDTGVLGIFEPWLPPIFGVGAVLLVGGLAAAWFAPAPAVQDLDRRAADVGWRLMFFAGTIFVLTWASEHLMAAWRESNPR